MSHSGSFQSKKARTILGLVVVAVSFVVAATLAGIGFAWSGISSSQYEYGKVTMCHHTHSKKNPNVTITVSKNAVPAHLKHGDTMGACPPSTKKPGNQKPGNDGDHGKGKGGEDDNNTTTTAAPTTTTPTTGDDHGKGNDNGHGNGNGNNGNGGNGNGKGHGK